MQRGAIGGFGRGHPIGDQAEHESQPGGDTENAPRQWPKGLSRNRNDQYEKRDNRYRGFDQGDNTGASHLSISSDDYQRDMPRGYGKKNPDGAGAIKPVSFARAPGCPRAQTDGNHTCDEHCHSRPSYREQSGAENSGRNDGARGRRNDRGGKYRGDSHQEREDGKPMHYDRGGGRHDGKRNNLRGGLGKSEGGFGTGGGQGSKTCFTCGDESHMARDCPNKRPSHGQQNPETQWAPPDMTQPPPGLGQQVLRRRDESAIVREHTPGINVDSQNKPRRCFNCGDENHMIRDCPIPDTRKSQPSYDQSNQAVFYGAPMMFEQPSPELYAQPQQEFAYGYGFSGVAPNFSSTDPTLTLASPPSKPTLESRPRTCHICGKEGHIRRECPQLNVPTGGLAGAGWSTNVTADKYGPSLGYESNLQPPIDAPRPRKQVTCYNCKEEGHFSRDCPKKMHQFTQDAFAQRDTGGGDSFGKSAFGGGLQMGGVATPTDVQTEWPSMFSQLPDTAPAIHDFGEFPALQDSGPIVDVPKQENIERAADDYNDGRGAMPADLGEMDRGKGDKHGKTTEFQRDPNVEERRAHRDQKEKPWKRTDDRNRKPKNDARERMNKHREPHPGFQGGKPKNFRNKDANGRDSPGFGSQTNLKSIPLAVDAPLVETKPESFIKHEVLLIDQLNVEKKTELERLILNNKEVFKEDAICRCAIFTKCTCRKRMIVFAKTRKTLEAIKVRLSTNQIPTAVAHDEMDQSDRKRVLARFKNGVCHILLLMESEITSASDVLGDADWIVNLSIPSTIEEYKERVKMATRDGKYLLVTSFYDTLTDHPVVGGLIEVLKDSGEEVPKWLEEEVIVGPKICSAMMEMMPQK